ncbi:uncharacterized protein LOC119185039 isoform X2 [Rhipicephalus microplus]|uniref:uncharacterized protein LOC119185039 isoform X2 n=1 Tax=Rhipicephalus microplus TaxID=6941 RepID=UPI003F6D93CF
MNNAAFVDDVSEVPPLREPHNALRHMDNEPPTQKRRKVNQTNAPWRVAVVGSLIVLFATSVFGTSGLFYVYFMDTFSVSHEAASWPGSTMAAMLNCAGLVVSLLQRFLSIFQISLVGSVLLWTSLMLAAFAPNMEVMTLLLGAVHGFFRDTKGSYDSLVRLIAGLAATSATLILLLRIPKRNC